MGKRRGCNDPTLLKLTGLSSNNSSAGELSPGAGVIVGGFSYRNFGILTLSHQFVMAYVFT